MRKLPLRLREQLRATPLRRPHEREKMEIRLTEIEIKLTQMEDLLESLNLTVYRQQEQISSLQQQQHLLSQQLQQMALPERRESDDETPPHY